MNNSKSISRAYSLLQGLYWMSYGVFYSFTAVFLLDRDFSDGQVGAIVALSCAFSALFQPHIASAADRSTRFTIRSLLTLLTLATIIPAAALFFVTGSKIFTAVCYVILILLHLSFQPLLSALAMHLINHGCQINFGMARGIGSISYALLTFFLGSLTILLSTRCLPVIGIIIYVSILVLLRVFPDLRGGGNSVVSSAGTIEILRHHSRFAVLVLGIILVFLSHSTINTYTIQIMERAGKGNDDLGRVMAYTAMLEFLVMILFTRISKGRDYGNILKFSAVFFVIKGAATAMAYTLPLIYASFTLQIFGFALFTPASVYYADSVLDSGDKVKGQALVTMAITAGNILGSLISGFFIELWGITPALWISTGFCLIGMVFFFIGAEKSAAHT